MAASTSSGHGRAYLLYSILFCITALLAASAPFFLVPDPILQVHDNLDGTNLVLLHVLKSYGQLFSFQSIVPMLHGLSRLFFPSELKLWGFIFAFFNDFVHAYLVMYVLKLGIGFVGMYLFLQRVIAKGRGNVPLLLMVAACFAILPCQPENGISFASVPLIFVLFHALYKAEHGRLRLLAAIACYPLLSDFSRFGFYILLVLGCFALWDLVVRKKPHLWFWAGMVLLAAGYVLTEYRLFYTFLWLHPQTIREEFQLGRCAYFTFNYTVSETLKLLLNGQYHFAATAHKLIIFPVVGIYLLVSNCIRNHRSKTASLMAAAFFLIIVMKFIYLSVVVEFLDGDIHWLRIIQLDRVYIFLPIVLYSLFFLALTYIFEHIGKITAVFLVSLQCVVIFATPAVYNDMLRNIRYDEYIVSNLGCREFFSKPLFDSIKKSVGYAGEWSVAVGFEPSILLYNGIHTLDGYHSYYPLSYKREFRKIIAPEIDNTPVEKEYFDNWGCRTYIFNEKAGEGRDTYVPPIELKINTQAFTRLGGRFIFSRAEIANREALGLTYRGTFSDPASPYTLFVYTAEAQ